MAGQVKESEVEETKAEQGKKEATKLLKEWTAPEEPFVYYKLKIKFLNEMLGTGTEASIYAEHILKKAQKMISEANKLTKKVTKIYAKFKGTDPISEIKEVEELTGIIRRYHEVLGKSEEIPGRLEEILAYSVKLDQEFQDLVIKGEQQKPTIFMRTADGMPMISTHMIIGFLKENLKIVVSNSTLPKAQRALTSKVQVQEVMALDVKPVEYFAFPDKDINRDEKGDADLCERPIRFERMGQTVTAIALSETLPAGAEFSLHLRVREDSPFQANDGALLRYLLKLGKSNGLGQWRGSGSKGQFCFQLSRIDHDPTEVPEGWE